MSKHKGPKILTLDIETRPAKVYVWDIFKPFINIEQIIEPGGVICMAAKWHHEKSAIFLSEWDDPNWQLDAWNLLNDADIVVTYNGDRFDIPHLNREFDELGFSAPSPFHSADLYKAVRKRERHISHKLAWVTKAKQLSGKMDSGGFRTWLDLNSDDELVVQRARRKMRKYNLQDVFTTEELFDNMLPHLTLPAYGLYEDGRQGCPRPGCGSTHVKRNGYKVARSRKYAQYQCQDCGGYFSETRSDSSVGVS